jgi:uncharacterized protein
VFSLLLFASPAVAEPALWVAKSGGATVYLFGTAHVLKADTNWWTPKIAAAFDRSDEIWIEAIAADPTTTRPLIAALGIDQEHSLSNELAPTDLARLDAAVKSAGFPGEATLDHMRPWLAALTLEDLLIAKAGYDSDRGVNMLLKERAALADKSVLGLETAEEQLHFFADLPQATQVELLRSVLDDVAIAPAAIDTAIQGWSSGDVEAFRKGTNELSEQNHPDLYAVVLVNRNKAWAEKIAVWMKSSHGQIFVAVGAGHFVGRDSLLNALEARGISVARD